MLVIRLQRVGRRGKALYRVVVQDSRQSPKSGKVINRLGSYDPHTKILSVDKESAQKFIDSGAHPSEKVAMLLKKEGLKLPSWVPDAKDKKRAPRKKVEEKPAPAPKAEGETESETEPKAEKASEPEAAEEPAVEPASEPTETTEPAEEPKAETETDEKPAEA